MYFIVYLCLFFQSTPTTKYYTYGHILPLHDALPISTRSSDGSSTRLSVAGGLALAAALWLGALPPASAQQLRQQLEKLTAPERGQVEPQVDAVTRADRKSTRLNSSH